MTADQRKYHLLPAHAYTSQDWFDREQRDIFSAVWRYAGLVEDIGAPGDYITVQAGLNNILIIKGRDHRLRAFHNICRHRGTQLLRAAGQTQKVITCPYHDWSYSLEGELLSIPDESEQFGDSVDKACLSLQSASVDIWRGMIFVHPEPNPPTLTEWFASVDRLLGPHKPEELVEYTGARRYYDVKANWKIVVENYIDVYHLSHLHANTLNMYDHAKAEYGFSGPHFAFWEPATEGAAVGGYGTGRVIPDDAHGVWVPMLFPGLGLAAGEEDWNLFIITPLAPDLTRIENRTKMKSSGDWGLFGGSRRRTPSKAATEMKVDRGGDPLQSGDFTMEDIYACEQQQKSFYSPYFTAGPASKGENPVLDHQRIVLSYVDSGPPEASSV